MSPEEARGLATRLSQGWPKGLTATAWQDALTNLDAGQAGTTFVRLQQTITEPTGPTVAAYLAHYQTLDTRRPDTLANCEHCSNTGWQPAWAVHPEHGHDYCTGVTPCRCPRGRTREDVHQRALDHNHLELERLGLHDNRRVDA